MQRILILLVLVAAVFITINRNRLYIRDPLGAVYKNDVKQEGVAVYINYANDVLVHVGHTMDMEEFLVQGWNRVPGIPKELKCLQGVVCLATADHAPMLPLLGASLAQMSNRQVSFSDETKTAVRISLR